MKVEKHPINKIPYEKMWAILSVDKKGNEGICMLQTPFGPQIAVTGADGNLQAMLEMVKTMDARQEAHNAGLRIVVGEFTRTSTTDLPK
jgi:uncharacterized alpha/beta hydrolase family protein